MNSLKSHDFGCEWICAAEQLLQMTGIIVSENEAFGPTVPDALDHGGMITHVWVDLTAFGERRCFRGISENTLPFSLGSVSFFFLNTFKQGCIQLVKSDNKDIYNVTKHLR